MDYNPFRSGRATRETVQEKNTHKTKDGKTARKGLWYNIHQKRKRGESPAKPGDKDYPKTLDIESKKEGYYKDLEIKKQDKEMGAKPVPAKKKNEAMDPVNKAELKGKHKDRKDKDIDNDGKVNDTDRYLHKRRKAVSKAIGEEMSIREKLVAVVERKDQHTANATPPETMKDKIKGQGAEDMMKAADAEIEKGPDAHLNEPEIDKKNFEKMTSNVPSKKMRNNDNPKGDTKIVPGGTQFKDPAAMKAEEKNDVTPFKVESYDKMSTLKAAYASMYETQTEEVKDAN
ncbi:hypothetical protein OAA57_00350 [bacterium]|jgi:hypothetical protein|nr:hypothetical protein [bacterium]MDB4350012.1 hypothetical protein [bacterium]